jgi:hypothetical protein
MAAARRSALVVARTEVDRRGRSAIAPLSAVDRICTEEETPVNSLSKGHHPKERPGPGQGSSATGLLHATRHESLLKAEPPGTIDVAP